VQSEGLKEATFLTIERQYMVGLRAADPEVRAKFFGLYNTAVPHSLYHRLKFILEEQDWTRASHTFWIKHGLVRFSSGAFVVTAW
jgi:transformation/transcription domain-associated protein